MVFLEVRRDSRVTTGDSGCLLCWPREVQSSIGVAKESWGLLSSDCRANRPHLGLCPEANVPLQGRQESRGCIPDSPGESGLISNGSKNCALLPSRDGSILEPLSVLKGVKPPVEFAEKTRDGSSGHAGNESPHLAMTGSSGDFSRDAAPVWVFSRGTTASSGSHSCGAREVMFPMRVARGSASLLSSHGRGIGPQDVLKKDSRGLSRVEARKPGVPGLVPQTAGSFSGCL